MDRVVVGGHFCEQLDIAVRNPLLKIAGHTHFQILDTDCATRLIVHLGVQHLAHRKVIF
jgi:hypothetical protein